MADEILPDDQRRMAITVVIESIDPNGVHQSKVESAMQAALRRLYGNDSELHEAVPHGIHLAISRLPYADLEARIVGWTREPTEEEEMGLVKHGEGSVVPENEQQKQGSKEGLTQEAVDEIVAEGDRDDD